eukprot:COSAG02_NODE_6073_length_3821_cov_18.905159_3_plen_114_part_01
MHAAARARTGPAEELALSRRRAARGSSRALAHLYVYTHGGTNTARDALLREMARSAAGFGLSPLGAGDGEFGGVLHVDVDVEDFLERARGASSELVEAVAASRGLLLIRGLHEV